MEETQSYEFSTAEQLVEAGWRIRNRGWSIYINRESERHNFLRGETEATNRGTWPGRVSMDGWMDVGIRHT